MNSFLDGLSKTERVEEFCNLLQYPEVQEALERIIMSSLDNHNIFMRLNLIEEHLGVDEYHCIVRDLEYKEGDPECNEEKEPVTPIREQVNEIYKAIDSIPISGETETIIGNITENRIRLLIKKLESVNPRPNQSGIRYMTSSEVGKYIQTEIDKDCRYEGNARTVRNDLMRQTEKKFPDKVRVRKNENGNKSLRIELIKK